MRRGGGRGGGGGVCSAHFFFLYAAKGRVVFLSLKFADHFHKFQFCDVSV